MEAIIKVSAPNQGAECTVRHDCPNLAVYKMSYESKTLGIWHACHEHIPYVVNGAMVELLNK